MLKFVTFTRMVIYIYFIKKKVIILVIFRQSVITRIKNRMHKEIDFINLIISVCCII